MTPLVPWMLAGGAAISVPIALHFFFRARHKPLPWAPMKFLKEAIEQTSRRLRFQEILLLILRCLALILLAVALARFASEKTAAGGADEPIDAVFVIDNSYSMAAMDGDKTRFDRAKEAALAVLKTLPDKSTVRIYSCSDRAKLLGPEVATSRDQAEQVIKTLELSSLSTDFKDGLDAALAALDQGSSAAKEVYVFTDMQKSGFDRNFDVVKKTCADIKAKGSLIFIRCGNPDRKVTNVAVIGVRASRTIPHTGTSVPFDVTLKNTGRETVHALRVGLELDGKSLEKDWVQVEKMEPGAQVTVTLSGEVKAAGPRRLRVHIEGDGVPGDNVFHAVVGVRDKVRVLLVGRQPRVGENYDTAADWFVHKAFYPFTYDPAKPADREKVNQYFIQVERVSPQEADPAKLADKDICYLLNAPARTDNPLEGLPPKFVEGLAGFVNKGGGLVIGCGDAVNPGTYNGTLGKAGLLPFPLGAPLAPPKAGSEPGVFLPAQESVAPNSPLAPLAEPLYSDWLRRAELTRIMELKEDKPADGARVLMRTTDGKPLVASRVVGDGEVIFFATTLDDGWGRLMSDGQLAGPMTTFLVAHLSGRKGIAGGGVRGAGTPFVWHPPSGAPGYTVDRPTKPGDTTRKREALGAAKGEPGQRPAVTVDETFVAGEYTIAPTAPAKPGEPGDPGTTFYVNPDLRETENLDVIADGDLEKALGFRPTIITAGADVENAVRDRRVQNEWTVYLLLALVFLLVVEAAWAWLCGRAW